MTVSKPSTLCQIIPLTPLISKDNHITSTFSSASQVVATRMPETRSQPMEVPGARVSYATRRYHQHHNRRRRGQTSNNNRDTLLQLPTGFMCGSPQPPPCPLYHYRPVSPSDSQLSLHSEHDSDCSDRYSISSDDSDLMFHMEDLETNEKMERESSYRHIYNSLLNIPELIDLTTMSNMNTTNDETLSTLDLEEKASSSNTSDETDGGSDDQVRLLAIRHAASQLRALSDEFTLKQKQKQNSKKRHKKKQLRFRWTFCKWGVSAIYRAVKTLLAAMARALHALLPEQVSRHLVPQHY